MLANFTHNVIFNLLENIALLYFGGARCIAFFETGEGMTSTEKISFDSPIVIKTIVNTENLYDNILETLNMGCSVYIIKSNDTHTANQFLDAYERAVFKADYRIGYRKMIIALNDGINDPVEILNHSLFNGFPEVLLVKQSSAGSYELSTTQYVGLSNQTQKTYLDTWYPNGSFLIGSDLFPDKLTNMKGRSLRLSMFNYKPYSIWKKVSSGGNAGFEKEGVESRGTAELDGTEARICLEFCVKHNCCISLVTEDEDEWGEIYDNGTGIGILGGLSERRGDIGISALYSWYHEYGFLDLSMPMVRTGITVIAPAPILLPGWSIPIRPFSTILWITVLVSLLIYIVFSYAFNKISKAPSTSMAGETFIVVRYLMMQPPREVDIRMNNRYMLTGILTLCLMLTNAYGGGLSSVMTVPTFSSPIDTVQDLASSNIEWGATHDAWIFSILLATEPNLIKVLSKFNAIPEEELMRRSKTRNFAFSVERLPAGHFAIGDYIDEQTVDHLRLMKEDIYWEQCVAMMPKSSPILNAFNMHVLRLHESGLLVVWESQVSMKYQDNKIQLGVRLSTQKIHDQTGPVNLRPDHLLGVYAAWSFGMGLAIVVFIVELLMGKLNLKRNAVIEL